MQAATTRFLARGMRPGLHEDGPGLFAQMPPSRRPATGSGEQGTPNRMRETSSPSLTIERSECRSSLAPGKKADVSLLLSPPLVAASDSVAFGPRANTQSVDTVIVDVSVRKRDGNAVSVDIGAMFQRLRHASSVLLERSGFQPPDKLPKSA